MVEKLNEDYVYKWSIIDFIMNFFVILLFSYVGGIFVILYISLQFNINLYQYFSVLINYIVPIMFIIIVKFRKRIINHLINKAYRNKKLSLLYKHKIKFFYIQIFLLVYNVLIIYMNSVYENIITDNNVLLITSINIIFLTTYFIFGKILSESGLVFIEFSELSTNIHNFEKRQDWLTKICERISDVFKKGNLMVNKEELRSSFNLQMRNSENMILKINEMKNWFLSEDKKDEVFSIFEKIWPTVKPVPYIKLTRYERIARARQLLPFQDVKWLVVLILAIMLLIQNPSSFIEIIKQLMDKLV